MSNASRPNQTADLDHSSKWGVVVIGCSWGANLARATTKQEHASVLAVVDLDRAKAERLGSEVGATAFTDYRQALEQPGVNVALIAVGPELHKEVAYTCFDKQLHVYVEKPTGHERHPEEVLEMAERAEAAGVRFMPGYSQRFAPYAATALDVVRSGALGTILSVDILRQAYFGPDWTQAPGWGIHDYDLCNLLAGSPPAAVTAFSPEVGSYAEGHTTEVLVEHMSGVLSRCKTSMFTMHHEVTVRVQGDLGELVAQHVEGRTRVWTGEREWEIVYHKAPEFWEVALEKFFAYLAGKVEQPVPPTEIVQGRRILDTAWRSLEERQRILIK